MKENARMQNERKVYQLFKRLNMNPSNLGYTYLKEAIVMVQEDPSYINSITKRLYVDVANKYETKSSRVDRAMRHAIEKMFESSEASDRTEVFGAVSNITNSAFIAAVIEYFKYN